MTLKEEILNTLNPYEEKYEYIKEMAQSHFDDKVADLILNSKYDEAAQAYIDNHGTAKLATTPKITINKLRKGEFAKGLKVDQEKVKKISDRQWDEFIKAYEASVGSGGSEKRKYEKSIGKVDAATGEVKTSATATAKGTAAKATKLEEKVIKLIKEFDALVRNKDLPEAKREEALAHVDGLDVLLQSIQFAKAGRSLMPPQSEEEVKKLKERYEKIGKTYSERNKVRTDVEGEAEPEFDEEIAKKATDRLIARLNAITDLDDVDQAWRDWVARKREMKERLTKKETQTSESINLKGKILAESYGYEGVDFWENYTMSAVVRMFNEDCNSFGTKTATELYISLFGKKTTPIFEHMANNKVILEEVAKTKGFLLFEEVGYNNVLMEDLPTVIKGGGSLPQEKVSFLKSLWDKVKSWGMPIVDNLGKFLKKGVSWAKDIAQKGLTWIAESPIASIAVPAIAIAGGIGAGIALINKLRKKKGKEKLSQKEEEELKSLAYEKDEELDKLGIVIEPEE